MTAQKRHVTRHQRLRVESQSRRAGMARRALFAAALIACGMPAVGCKTGTSFAKPSWMNFGGTPKTDADSLAAAPPYGGDIKKPSESAKPYPTTSTPSGYVITGSASPADTAAQQFQAAQPQTPVIYGSTPPPQTASSSAAAVASVPPAAGPQQSIPSSIAPQVGPYASLDGDSIPPPGQPLPPLSPSTTPSMGSMPSMASSPSMASGPGMTSTPSEASLPNAAYSGFSSPSASSAAPAGMMPPPRMADARAADPAAAIPAAALPAEAAAAAGSRYSTSTSSRFGGTEAASFPPAPTSQPAAYGSPLDTGLPATPADSPYAAPPAASPAGVPAAPGLLQPSAQPVRRPDPGYRPGGTSSYRPSRAILADDSAPVPGDVRTASFEEPAAGTIRQ